MTLTLTEALRLAIQKSGKSQNQLAKESGVSQSTLNRFVNGVGELRLKHADKLAKVLGLRLK